MRFGNIFGVHEQALLLRARRAEVLATNLANADTPDFKARDIDFRAVLANATGTGSDLRKTNDRHLSVMGQDAASAQLMYRYPLQPSLDGNTVDTQIEQSAFMRNALDYQASLSFVNSRITGLVKALRGE
jgi:flagellar basal-body rod protein FlgB